MDAQLAELLDLPFLTGVRHYFGQHAWGNATLGDLLAARMKPLGFEISQIPTPEAGKSHFIARLRGDGSKRPVLLAAHADVVGAVAAGGHEPVGQAQQRRHDRRYHRDHGRRIVAESLRGGHPGAVGGAG